MTQFKYSYSLVKFLPARQKFIGHPTYSETSREYEDEFKEERKTEIKNHRILARLNSEKRSSRQKFMLQRAQSEISTNVTFAKYRERHRKSAHM